MGAWGTGIFENDAASDWGAELAEHDDIGFVEETLGKVVNTGAPRTPLGRWTGHSFETVVALLVSSQRARRLGSGAAVALRS